MGPLFAFGVVTFRRWDIVSQTLPHLRAQFPHVPIYVADQNGNKENLELYEKVGAEVLWLDFDAGLSKARNELMRSIEKDYVFLIDDDDVIAGGWDQSFIDELCGLLERNVNWLAIAGHLRDRDALHKRFVHRSHDQSSLALVDSTDEVNVSFRGREVTLIEADYVLNFGLFSRKRIVESKLFWDERLKVMEHEDFFLQLSYAGGRGEKYRVFFFGELLGYQLAGTKDSDYAKYRRRFEYWNILSRKWKFDYHDLGEFGIFWANRDKLWAEALGALSSVLRSMGLIWWISNGTLLGLIREGNFLHHDDDVDVTLEVEAERLRELEKLLLHRGFRVFRAFGNPKNGLEWTLIYELASQKDSVFPPPRIDLFFADRVPGGLITTRYASGRSRQFLYPEISPCPIFVDAWGIEVNRPLYSEKLLELEYGPHWTDSEPEWDYFESPFNALSPLSRSNTLRGGVYRLGLYLRSSSPRYFLWRHPKLESFWQKAVWVKNLPGRTVAYVMRRIKRFDVAIFLLSVRYYIKFWSPKMRKSGSDGDPSIPVFWINLPKNTDRSSRVGRQFELLEIRDAQRFDGVPSENGALGCALAHINVLRNYPNSAPAIMVCEDDVEFLVARSYLDTVLKEFFANPALSVLCLGFNSFGRTIDVSKNLLISRRIQTTSCYVVKAEAVHFLLKSFLESAEKLERGGDERIWAIDQHWTKLQGGKLFFAVPRIRVAKQAAGFSDVRRAWVNYGT